MHKKWNDLLFLKAITMIDPMTRYFEVAKYRSNKAMAIENLVETMWLVWYSCPGEITYNQGGEFFGHKFKSFLI